MADLAVLVTYDLLLARTAETSVLGAGLPPRLVEKSRYGLQVGEEFPYTIAVTLEESGNQIAVYWCFITETDKTSLRSASSSLRPLVEDLLSVAAYEIKVWIKTQSPGLIALCNELEDVGPCVTVKVPLLGSDRKILLNNAGASRALEASIREVSTFLGDQERCIKAITVQLESDSLRITASDSDMAIVAGEAYLTATRRQARPRDSVPATSVWAWTSVAIALTSVGLSFLALNWETLAVFAALVLVGSGAAVILAPRFSAGRLVTGFGLVPILTLSLFAFVYSVIAILEPSAITSYGAHLQYLREPLLLSLSLLTTVGVLDLSVHDWVRSVAYLEMLLVASLAGGAAIVAVRRVSRRAQALVDELRRERG